jgi:hypothetical protein
VLRKNYRARFFVGFVELLMSLWFYKKILLNDGFDIDYAKSLNEAKKANITKQIQGNLEQYKDLIDINISVDRELYSWAMQVCLSSSMIK